MKIVAFLQNPWFKPGTLPGIIEKYRDDQEFHRRILCLSMTGRRLHSAFGDLFKEIYWDNTNWRAGAKANVKMPADLAHMRAVIFRENPELVILFGGQSLKAYRELMWNHDGLPPYLKCHHPNARHRTQLDLCGFAAVVRHHFNS